MIREEETASVKAPEAAMTKVGSRIARTPSWLRLPKHKTAMRLERKPWNKLHIIKYNYKKFKHMLRTIQLYISMVFSKP